MTLGEFLRMGTCAAVLLVPVVASAQSADEGHLEISGGVGWFGAATVADVDAEEATPAGGRRSVFRTRTALEASAGLAVRVGVRLASWVHAESALALNPTHLATRISADVEQAPDVTASEAVTQYLIEGGLVAHLGRWRAGRSEPFAAAGVGYLRQLNEGQTFVQTGRSYYVGGGTHYVLKRGGAGRIRSAGIRAEVRATILENGVALDRTRVVPMVGAAVFVRF